MAAAGAVTVAEGENITDTDGMGISNTTIIQLCELVCGCRDGSCKNFLGFLTPVSMDCC